jgi:hypothetical protein
LKYAAIAPLFASVLCIIASAAQSADQEWIEAGARVGFSKEVRGENFNQLEMVAAYRLPRSWVLDSGWIVESRLNASAGVLDGGGDSAAIVSVGPGLAWINPGRQFTVEAGISPTLMTRHEFGDADFGGPFRFTSLNSRIGKQTTAAVRIQHMSNAGIYDSNPGLDQVMLGINYLF